MEPLARDDYAVFEEGKPYAFEAGFPGVKVVGEGAIRIFHRSADAPREGIYHFYETAVADGIEERLYREHLVRLVVQDKSPRHRYSVRLVPQVGVLADLCLSVGKVAQVSAYSDLWHPAATGCQAPACP